MVNKSAVRERILDTASKLFYEQGYNLTGINQVYADSKVAKGSLYNHFPAKTDLLHAYVQRRDEAWFHALDRYLAKIKDPRDKILGIFDFRIDRQIEQKFGGCPFVKISAEIGKEEKRTFHLVRKHKEHLRTYIRNLISQMKPAKRTLNDDMLAETIFLLMEGATVMVSIQKQNESLSKAKQIAQQLLT